MSLKLDKQNISRSQNLICSLYLNVQSVLFIITSAAPSYCILSKLEQIDLPSDRLISKVQDNTDNNSTKETDKTSRDVSYNEVVWKCHNTPSRLWWCDTSHLRANVTVTLGGAAVTLRDGATLG
jgi:hypothetical protein